MSTAVSAFIFSPILGNDISDALLSECANLFSTNYGVWGEGGPRPGAPAAIYRATVNLTLRLGASVKMPAGKLKKMIFAAPESTALATCTVGGILIGHAFAAVWSYDGGECVCSCGSSGCQDLYTTYIGRSAWVTQLVVDKAFRRRYVATQLVQTFKRLELFRGITAIGIASSQPASIAACIKYSRKSNGHPHGFGS